MLLDSGVFSSPPPEGLPASNTSLPPPWPNAFLLRHPAGRIHPVQLQPPIFSPRTPYEVSPSNALNVWRQSRHLSAPWSPHEAPLVLCRATFAMGRARATIVGRVDRIVNAASNRNVEKSIEEGSREFSRPLRGYSDPASSAIRESPVDVPPFLRARSYGTAEARRRWTKRLLYKPRSP